MIRFEPLSQTAIKVVASGKLTADDFRLLAPPVDAMIDRRWPVRVLVDASGFDGWENFRAFESHAGFVKTRQMYVERLAVIVGRDWQKWLVETLRMFLHPDAKSFDSAQEGEAMRWILEA